jgi:hypothetical protein
MIRPDHVVHTQDIANALIRPALFLISLNVQPQLRILRVLNHVVRGMLSSVHVKVVAVMSATKPLHQ